MSTYTISLKELVTLYSMEEAINVRDRIEVARTKIFDFDYPFFDQTKKADFETHFIRNFFMREIGFETEDLWKFNLENWLNINMPYWNKMFESELITFDPLANTKTDSTHNETKDQTNTSNSETKGSSTGSSTQTENASLTENDFQRRIESDTPDTRLSITANNGQGVIEYANRIEEDTDNKTESTTSNGSATSKDNTDVTNNATLTNKETNSEASHTEGKIGSQSFSEMIQEYRDTFMRIEKQIFNEMNQLFMLVY
jgi:hypothetical protein